MRRLVFGLILIAASASAARAVVSADDAHPAAGASEHAAAGAATHAEASHGEPNILELKLPLAICTALVFLALFGILWRFAWGPLSKALDARERYHEESLAKAENARADGERLLAEHRALMAKAGDDVRAILDEARRDAEALGNSIVSKAQGEAVASKERAERDIATARDQALADIWTRTADLAVNVAGRVLSHEIGPDDRRRLLDRAINELPAVAVNGSKDRA